MDFNKIYTNIIKLESLHALIFGTTNLIEKNIFIIDITTPSNVLMLWVTTCKTIRSSLGVGFSRNPVKNYLLILYLFVNI